MKRERIKPIGAKTGMRNLRFLLCDIAGGAADPTSPQEEWVTSPIQCLDRAVERKARTIVISFMRISIREREALVELSAALKRNSHTKQCTVLALLHSKHRKLIEDLKQARVDYIRYIGEAKLDSNLVREIIEDMGPGDSPDKHLETLCPFLHYSRIDSQHEMTVCGAYLDRMVLGGYRLCELCQSKAHLHCEYYLSPRVQG